MLGLSLPSSWAWFTVGRLLQHLWACHQQQRAPFLHDIVHGLQSKAASDTRLARDIKQAEDKAEADAAEEQRLRQEEMDSIDRWDSLIAGREQNGRNKDRRPKINFARPS